MNECPICGNEYDAGQEDEGYCSQVCGLVDAAGTGYIIPAQRVRDLVREEVALILAEAGKAGRKADRPAGSGKAPASAEALGGSGDAKACQWHGSECKGRKRNGGPC